MQFTADKMSKSMLKRLYLDDNRRRFPSLPDTVRTVPKWTDKTANGLTKMILDFLRLKGHQCERVAVTGRYMDNSKVVMDVLGNQRRIGSGHWIKASMQPGTADLSCIIKNSDGIGISIKIEIKVGRDRQSKAQKRYQEQVEAAGGIYIIAKSFTQFYMNYIKIRTYEIKKK